jgi:hypothetical protein
MKKTEKINTFAYEIWKDIEWDNQGMDKNYLEQVVDYLPDQEPDDACFVAGTKILTLHGQKNIEDVTINDKVLTPYGFRKVLFASCTGEKEVISKIGVIGTANHKVYSKKRNAFIPLSDIQNIEECDRFTLRGSIIWKLRKLLSLTEKSTHVQERQSIIFAKHLMPNVKMVAHNSIEQFGNFITKKQFLKATLYITKILMLIITTFLIWSYLRIMTIPGFMQDTTSNVLNMLKKIGRIWIKYDRSQKHGIEAQKGLSGTRSMLQNLWLKLGVFEKKEYVNIVENRLLQKQKWQDAVQTYVKAEKDDITENQNRKYVFNAGKNIQSVLTGKLHCSVPQSVKRKVYNLTVDKEGVYYANGVLVSNCDSLASLAKEGKYSVTKTWDANIWGE